MTSKPEITHYETSYDYYVDLIKNNRLKLADNFLVARIDIQQKHGSIILPDCAQTEQNTATIMAIAANLDAKDFPIGAHIMQVQHSGRELCSKNNDRLVIYDTKIDIHAIFVEDAK